MIPTDFPNTKKSSTAKAVPLLTSTMNSTTKLLNPISNCWTNYKKLNHLLDILLIPLMKKMIVVCKEQ